MEETKGQEPICNLCGCTCNIEGFPCGLIKARAHGAYFSTPGTSTSSEEGALDDMNAYTFNLCEFCLDWLFSTFKIPVDVFDYTFRPAWTRVTEDEWRKHKDVFYKEATRRESLRTILTMVRSYSSGGAP